MLKESTKKTLKQRAQQVDAIERRAVQEKFQKQRNSFFKGATLLSKDCKAKVYILISRHSKFFTFKTKERPN